MREGRREENMRRGIGAATGRQPPSQPAQVCALRHHRLLSENLLQQIIRMGADTNVVQGEGMAMRWD